MSTNDSEVKSKSCNVTNHEGDEVKVNVKVDFTNATRDQLLEWAVSSRIIVGQRVWRDLSKKELESKVEGKTFDALTIGHKIKSREDQVKATMNPAAGVTRELAEWIVDNPVEYRKMLETMKSETKK